MTGDSVPLPKAALAADSCTMVVFGASGDLTHRKLIPSLYHLAAQKLLPDSFSFLGIARRPMSDDEFRRKALEGIEKSVGKPLQPAVISWLSERLHYLAADFSDPASFGRLNIRGNVLFYLATAPEFFSPIARGLGDAGLLREERGTWRRVIVEKPFGLDLESAKCLNADLRSVMGERQIYRIDHYLGKETVQNILVFRFANGMFEPIWNHRFVDHIQITAAEELGVGSRGGYFDKIGVLRDMVPNHLFQLLSLTTMEPPISLSADGVRDKQVELLRSLAPLDAAAVGRDIVRGQYASGTVEGDPVTGYLDEEAIDKKSRTETFAALKLSIDNWRWAGVPFYLRTGKRLPMRSTEIVVQFRAAPFHMFRDTPVSAMTANQLIIRIQPREGIALEFCAKIPGPSVNIGSVEMNFDYHDYFGQNPSTGYERLLYDAMTGDATLFQRADMVEAAWAAVAPIQDAWAKSPDTIPQYSAGSWGPDAGEDLLRRDGRRWRECRG